MIPFRFSRVLTSATDRDKTMEEIFRLRFKVYCEEWGFEDPRNYPDGQERNEFDDKSEHFAIWSTSDESIVGSARIILPSDLGYPLEENCELDPALYKSALGNSGISKIGEVSRLAISKEYRKRIEDNVLMGFSSELPTDDVIDHEKRKCNYVHEFYKYLLLQSIEVGLTHWYVAMKRGLYVLLKRVGMVYHPIGPEIDYHGLRTPYLGNLQEIKECMIKKDPHCFEFIEKIMLKTEVNKKTN